MTFYGRSTKLKRRYLTVEFIDDSFGGLRKLFGNLAILAERLIENADRRHFYNIGNRFQPFQGARQLRAYQVEIKTQCGGKQFKTSPSLLELFSFRHVKLCRAYFTIARRHHTHSQKGNNVPRFFAELFDSMTKPQIKTELLALRIPLFFFSVELDFCDCAAVGQRSRAKRDNRSHQWLPVFELEIRLCGGNHDRQNKNYADRSRNTGPLWFFHPRNLPRIPILVERVAA
jgi:hypothetical protein